MILGVGVDVLEVPRVGKELRRNAGLREQLFTAAEIRYCEGKRTRACAYAARFAAKEALSKALGVRFWVDLLPTEAEVLNDRRGRPRLVLRGRVKALARRRGVKRILVSLSHVRAIAAAIVVLER